MTDNGEVRNTVGTVIGTAVQTGSINQMIINSPAPRHAVPHQLPGRINDFTGKRHEIAVLYGRLPKSDGDTGSAKTMVLHGAAGTGKTTLAVWWAHEVREEFPDGTLFTDLRGFGPGTPATPSTVLSGFLVALGVPIDQIPIDTDALSGLYRSLLADREVLVVLDNAVNAEQVRPLLPAGSGCVALITSRRILHGLALTHSVSDVPVGLFTDDEAFDLVASVIGADRADLERDHVTDLIRTCDRLPLALRLAATRVTSDRFTGIADVVNEIRRGLSALDKAGDERSAITSVFDQSYRALPADQARLFGLLGLHPAAEFGLHAAAALDGGLPDRTADRLGPLADEHLVQQIERQRYRVHDLLHAYALTRNTDQVARDAALTRLVTWYALAADRADELVFPGQPRLTATPSRVVTPMPIATRSDALQWLQVEHTTLAAVRRMAVDRGLTRAVILLAGAAQHLLLGRRSLWRDRLDAENDGLRAARSAENLAAEEFLLIRRGNTHRLLGNYEAANTDFRSVLEFTGDPYRRYEALCGLGSDGRDRGRPEEALEFYESALPIAEQTGDLLAKAIVVCNLGQINATLGRFDLARTYANLELALRRGADDAIGVAYAQHNKAVAHQGLGDDEAAIDLCERALATYADDDATVEYRATTLTTLSLSFASTGRAAAAARCLRTAAELLASLGSSQAGELERRAGELEAGAVPVQRLQAEAPISQSCIQNLAHRRDLYARSGKRTDDSGDSGP